MLGKESQDTENREQRTEDKTSLKQLEKAPLSLKKIKIMQEKRRPIV